MFNTSLPKQAAVYCRVSSEIQQERQTIESQVDFARKYCELNGIEITEIYRDDGITGTLPLEERPAGAQLLADAKCNLFQLLLIFKLDRLGRNTRVILNAVHDLDKLNVKVRSMTEPFDTSDASGRFLLTILAGVADLERSNILQRMDLGANRAAKEGKWLGGIVPYGYFKNQDKYIEPNNAKIPGFDMSEVDVVKVMYERCVKGDSCIKIAEYLNALAIPPAWVAHSLGGKRRNNTSGLWTSGRVLQMLRSSTYKGVHVYGKRSQKERERISRVVPAIVDVDTWEKAQQVLTSNRLESVKNTKHKYLLKSIVKCEDCGSTYRGNPAGPKSRGGYYSCGGRANYKRMNKEKCLGMSLPMPWLDDFVWNSCLQYINNPQLVVESIESNAKESADVIEQKNLLAGRLATIDTARERLLDMYRLGHISAAEITDQLDKLKKDRDTISAEIDTLEKSTNTNQLFSAKETALNALELLQSTLRDSEPSFDVKQMIIRAMVQKVSVRTDRTGTKPRAIVTIYYNFTRTDNYRDNHADNSAGIVISKTEQFPPSQPAGSAQSERLLFIMKHYNITQKELARIAHTSSTAISGIVNGHYNGLRMSSVRSIAEHYGLSYAFVGAYESMPELTIQEKLKKGRMYRLLRQCDAATFFNVDTRTYGEWERGRLSTAPQASKVQPDKFAEWIQVFSK